MAEALTAHRQSISAYAPRIVTIKIPVDKIRDVIGPGGKMIRSIIERTGVKIDVQDDGTVNVASADESAAAKAIGIIQELTATAELNKTYLGKVQRITDFGAFVEIMPGTDGLLHVSEIAHYRVKDVRDELKEGQQVLVKVINIDPTGKIRLSRKALITPEEGGEPPASAEEEGAGAAAGGRPRRSPAPRPRPTPRPRTSPGLTPRALGLKPRCSVRECVWSAGAQPRRFHVRAYNVPMRRFALAAVLAALTAATTPSRRRAGAGAQPAGVHRSSPAITNSRRIGSRCRRTTWSRSRSAARDRRRASSSTPIASSSAPAAGSR